MIVDSAKLPHLISWLVLRLTPLTDAKPGTLAEYVVALLKSDREDGALKKYCISQLNGILNEHTAPFVDELFQVLKDESYMDEPIQRLRDSDDEEEEKDVQGRESEDEDEDRNRGSRRRGGDDDDEDRRYRGGSDSRRSSYEDSHSLERRQSYSSSNSFERSRGLNGRNTYDRSGGREASYDRRLGRNYPQSQLHYPAYFVGPPVKGIPPAEFPVPQGIHSNHHGNMPPMYGHMSMAGVPSQVFGGYPHGVMYPPPPFGIPEAAEPASSLNPNAVPYIPTRPAPPPGPAPLRQAVISGPSTDDASEKPPEFLETTDEHHPAPAEYPVTWPHSAMPMYPMQGYMPGYIPSGPQMMRAFHNETGGGRKRNFGGHSNALPENEQCTLRCTGIKQDITEAALRGHFRSFGRVVILQLSPSAEPKSDGKVYNECLVQFADANDARKCLKSSRAVLNNRYIHIYSSSFNVIPPADVPPPTPEEFEEQRQFQLKRSRVDADEETGGESRQGRKRPAVTTPFVGGRYLNQTYVAPKPAPVPSADSDSQPPAASASSAHENLPQASTEAESVIDGAHGATKSATASASNNVPSRPPPPRPSAPSKEEVALHQQYDGLKKLRGQADNIWRQKEQLIQAQMEKYREMLKKLESAEDSTSNRNLIENLEGKVVNMQSQLRQVREERDKGVVSIPATAPAPSYQSTHYVNPAAGRSGDGRRGGHAGRGYAHGRGRGYHHVAANLVIDNRPKALVVAEAPESFINSAEAHFARFGKLEGVEMQPNGEMVVRFESRKVAEIAKRNGAIYEGQPLSLNWFSNGESKSHEPFGSGGGGE